MEETILGRLVDLPIEEFKREIVEQKVPIGIIKNLELSLLGAYNELCNRKEMIVRSVFDGKLNRNDPMVVNTLNGLYAEMLKIEQKSLYLKERSKELIEESKKGDFDSPQTL